MTLNILSLWPRRLFETKQSPSRRFQLRALADRSDINLHQTGPGFSDWKESHTGMQNIERLMPECDAVISYKALSGCEYGAVGNPLAVSKNLLTIEQFNECHAGFPGGGAAMHNGGGTAAEECRKSRIGLVVIHHENDRPRMQSVEDYGAKLIHIPHGAAPMFAEEARPWSERSGVVLTGVLNAQHYPLRQRWAELIASGKIKGTHYRRPGNYSASVEESDRLVREYAGVLGKARVKLGCSSVWKYQLQHFSEAGLAGCAHVADMPDGVALGFEWMLHAVRHDATDAELIAAVDFADENAEDIGRAAQDIARVGWTTARYAERLVSAIREMIHVH